MSLALCGSILTCDNGRFNEMLREIKINGDGYWYKSPWVSTDIIIQFIFHASPAQRGLEIDDDVARKAEVWYYPSDYPERVVSRLKAYLARVEQGETIQDAVGRPTPP